MESWGALKWAVQKGLKSIYKRISEMYHVPTGALHKGFI